MTPWLYGLCGSVFIGACARTLNELAFTLAYIKTYFSLKKLLEKALITVKTVKRIKCLALSSIFGVILAQAAFALSIFIYFWQAIDDKPTQNSTFVLIFAYLANSFTLGIVTVLGLTTVKVWRLLN